ncbi:MAG: CpcT/CpeT family chromophore lyase [Planctomycetota bacterium]|nr:CpcT/CpeT family chromophore lyase [Planctomycetota bacterium]
MKKIIRSRRIVPAAALAVWGCLTPALVLAQSGQAQPAQPVATEPAPGPTPPPVPTWSDPEFERIAKLLTGSWKTSKPIPTAGGDSVEMVMSIAPVVVQGIPNALYVETARADALHRPSREAVFELYKLKGKVRLRTYDFLRVPDGVGSGVTGMWAAPEAFPQSLNRGNFIATLDVELAPSSAGYKGQTPYPYPTGRGGAVEMTSQISFDGSSITVADRGFDADGKVVWGAGNDSFVFQKFDPGVQVQRLDGGLVVLTYRQGTGEQAIENGDQVAVHYVGYLADGTKFDSSRDREQPLQFRHGGLIEGWNKGLTGHKVGQLSRLMIPAAMAYKEMRRGNIPPNSALYFETEVMSIQRPQAAPQPPAPPATPDASVEAQKAAEQKGEPAKGEAEKAKEAANTVPQGAPK